MAEATGPTGPTGPAGSQGSKAKSRPVLPPPPASLTEQDDDAAQQRAQAKAEDKARRDAERAKKDAARDKAKAERAAQAKQQREERAAEKEQQKQEAAAQRAAAERKAAEEREARAEEERSRTAAMPAVTSAPRSQPAPAPRRTRRAQLRLVQLDAWSVMKTSFLLSIALGIVLVVAVGIVWSVLGAAGVFDSINSIAQQAVGSPDGPQFDIRDYVGTSRVLGFAMIVAVVDVILITAIATLGAFLYNLSAALLGGIEVTLAEDN